MTGAHKPQSGEDWVATAERFIADGGTTEKSSPLFAGLVLAVRQRDALAEAVRQRDALSQEREGDR